MSGQFRKYATLNQTPNEQVAQWVLEQEDDDDHHDYDNNNNNNNNNNLFPLVEIQPRFLSQ
jgi:hypothetical protein